MKAGEPRILVTGLGVVSAAGEAGGLLAAARSGRPIQGDISAFEPLEGEPTRSAEMGDFDLAAHVPSVKSYIDRASALGLAAGKAALDSSGTAGGTGLIYGTQWGCLDSMELFFGKVKSGKARFAPPLPFSHSYANSPASVVAIELKLAGHHAVISSGRTSGLAALVMAGDAVALGRAGRVLTAASDSFSRSAFRHYLNARLLLPDDLPDALSDGRRMILGEGAAALVVESAEFVNARKAEAMCVLAGGATATGNSARVAIESAALAALERSGVRAEDVASVIGSGPTLDLSRAERDAAKSVAAKRFIASGLVLGETMGASGLMAAAVGCLEASHGPALVLCCEHENAGGGRVSAVAAVLAPAD